MQHDERTGWLGAHLYCRADIYSAAADRVVLEVVEPLAAKCQRWGWIERFFFIRYVDERGPHIRFRLLCRRQLGAEHIKTLVREALVQARDRDVPVLDATWVAYEPEVERYGGIHGLALAEEHFEDASRIAFELLGEAGTKRQTLLGKALLAQLVLLHTFLETRLSVARMARQYGTSYLRQLVPDPSRHRNTCEAFEESFRRQADHLATHVEAAWEALDAGTPLTPVMDRYRVQLRATRRRLRALASAGRLAPHSSWAENAVALVPSYLHMMNNRLGVSIQDECYLSVLISSALAAEPALVGA